MNIPEILDKLEMNNSSVDKINILKKNDSIVLRRVLGYAYEPLWKYGIQKLPWLGGGPHTFESLGVELWSVLTSLRTGELSGNAAIETVRHLIETLTRRDAEVLKKILKKDLRCGISATTVNKAMPGLVSEFGVMRAKAFENQDISGGVYVSLKLDGLRAILKDGELYTRNGRLIRGVEHITSTMPSDATLDGELMIPGDHFQDASGKIRSHGACPTAVYHVFDTPQIHLVFKDRLAHVVSLVNAAASPSIKLVRHVIVNNPDKIKLTFAKAIAAGYEGLVLKTLNHRYQIKRSSDWLKMKLTRDEDLPVVGFFEGEGRLEGTLGGIIVQRENSVLVRVGSGFSDALRNEVWANKTRFMGTLAEVQYHEATPDGSLRHPRLKGFRSDK